MKVILFNRIWTYVCLIQNFPGNITIINRISLFLLGKIINRFNDYYKIILNCEDFRNSHNSLANIQVENKRSTSISGTVSITKQISFARSAHKQQTIIDKIRFPSFSYSHESKGAEESYTAFFASAQNQSLPNDLFYVLLH